MAKRIYTQFYLSVFSIQWMKQQPINKTKKTIDFASKRIVVCRERIHIKSNSTIKSIYQT